MAECQEPPGPGGAGPRHDGRPGVLVRGRAGGRAPALDSARYKETQYRRAGFSKLKQFRAVATRYDKRDYMYQATIDVASIRIWLRDPVP